MTTVYTGPKDHRLPIKQVTAMSDPLLPSRYSYLFRISCRKLSHLLPLYRSQDLPLLLHIPKLQKPDALPGPCSELSIRYRYAHARAYQRRLDMCLEHRRISHLPSRNGFGAGIPAYHRSPLHRACIFLFRLLMYPSAKTQEWLCHHHLKRPSFLPTHLCNPPLSSFTIPSNASLISARTSSSQFSFIDSAQLVCCRKRCNSPHLILDIWGSEEMIWSVTR